MNRYDVVAIGAGVSGLSFANWYAGKGSVLVLERDDEPGGYCKTVKRDGFVWDYSGHFFHFKHAEIEAWLRARMPGQDVRTVDRSSLIRYRGRDIDFPFQKNIHQLDKDEFVDCLVDLFFRPTGTDPPASFGEMLYRRLGKSITDKFLRPYNEKLYAVELERLDPDAMGRFFPHADITDIIANMRPGARDAGYNATFTYPAGGAIEYIHALERDLPAGSIALGEPAVSIDVAAKTITTPARTIHYDHVVSSAPLPALAKMCGVTHAPVFTSNKVLVFNLGFDRKGARGVHWMYFPDPACVFYRVGWYDNILDTDRMSLYVEIGAPTDASFDVDALRDRVLADLTRERIIDGHRLVAHHHVVLDPAYAHITKASLAETARVRGILAASGVHAVGRYGGWTYCSIEDNMVETRELAARL
ncbi:MAG TPA: FAD-dependent oxidoreductase [Kofleriaceae bacterium]|nr:FAD-dependent oxidoreductase [Kofleriaceae bacterium]